MSTLDAVLSEVCTDCGMCCRGAVYAQVPLADEAEVAFAEGLGLTIVHTGGKPSFLEPCVCLVESTCSIYPDRFQTCRDYSCMLIGQLRAGTVTKDAALGIVRDLRRRYDLVAAELNPDNVPMPLSKLLESHFGSLGTDGFKTLPVARQRALLEQRALAMLISRHLDPRHASAPKTD